MLSCPPELSLLRIYDDFTLFSGDCCLMENFSIRRIARPLSLLVSLTFFLSAIGFLLAQQPRPARRPGARAENIAPAKGSRPRLVLLIVVDQFRYDYLTRFGDLFGSRGIGRLMRRGADWTHSNFDHVPTFTAPGHAVFMTGAWPSQTGIIANDWYEQDTGRRVKSITDDSTKGIAGKPNDSGKSPRRLLCSTVGDELKLADNDLSKVIGISAKDRSAILPTGRRANAAYWFSTDSGNMMSSTYYFNDVPEWVTRFNSHRMADKWFGARWDRLLPNEAEYLKRA